MMIELLNLLELAVTAAPPILLLAIIAALWRIQNVVHDIRVNDLGHLSRQLENLRGDVRDLRTAFISHLESKGD